MSKWSEFYHDRVTQSYADYFSRRYAHFLSVALTPYYTTCLEIGAGIGSTTRALAAWRGGGHGLYASDIDPEMLALMRRNLPTDATVIEHDARLPWHNKVELVHSHGLLEHYDNETIRQIIAAHRSAKLQVHYVPGQYGEPSFGDERLMCVQSWVNICNPDSIIVFNEGKDYALVFKGH